MLGSYLKFSTINLKCCLNYKFQNLLPIIFPRLMSGNADAWTKEKVVPDVIPDAPKEIANISYGKGHDVNMGNELTPKNVIDVPTVKWNADNKSLYVLLLTNPDAPNAKSPNLKEWHHWLIGNIPGSDVDKGEILSKYIGACPPKDGGFHRYVFLIFKQNKGKEIEFDEYRLSASSSQHRSHFSTVKFAKKYDLGTPVAGNFYIAQYDPMVPLMYRFMGT